MLLDGVFASEALDSSGEVLSVEGCDISTLDVDGVANWEHRGDDSPGHSPSDIVGRVVYAKKIFTEKDCENDRQRYYWNKVELPFIYGIVRLADGAGHAAAKDLAAHVRDHHANGESILVRYSIEGTTLRTSENKKHLLESVARKVAMTVKPCNRSAHSGILADPHAPEGFDKTPAKVEKDFLDDVLKRNEHEHPLYTRLGGSVEIECSPLMAEPDLGAAISKMEAVFKKNDEADTETEAIRERRKTPEARAPHKFKAATWTHPNGHPRCRLCGDEESFSGECKGADHDGINLKKTITAGNYNAAPGTLTGGAALQREDQTMLLRSWANRAKAALRDWDGSDKFKKFLKFRLPEASDDFIDRFSDMVEDHRFKKSSILLGKSERSRADAIRKFEALTIDLKKMASQIANGTVSQPEVVHEFQGRRVQPGHAVSSDGKSQWALMGESDSHYLAVPMSSGNLDADGLVRLPRGGEGKSFQVRSPVQAGEYVPTSSLSAQPQQMGLQNIFDVYQMQPKPQLAGRILKTGQNVDVLADFFGHLANAQGPLQQVQPTLDALQQQGFLFVSRADHRAGLFPDLVPEHQFASAPMPQSAANGDVDEQILAWPRPARPSEFEYLHPALKQPIPISVKDKVFYFNGHRLLPAERDRILLNIRNRLARIRYKNGQQQASILKNEVAFEALVKIEPHLQGALDELRAAVKAGHVKPESLKHITGHLFVDPMVKGVGNKKAYEDFLSRPKQGVHVRLDGNDFGSINKIHSFEHGNQAITAMGQAMREAMDEAVGRNNGKLFRIGGDEFHAHVPNVEHAAKFSRALRAKLEAIPPVGGTHALSVSAGFGHDPDSADQASILAKQAKKGANYQLGQAKTHVHSLVPGHEGAIPMDKEQLPTISPKAAGAAETPHPAPTPPAAPAAPAPVQPRAPSAPKSA